MYKTLHVVIRDVLSTVLTKAFILAAILPPALIGVAMLLMPVLMNQAAPKVSGRISIVDQSGAVAPRLADAFTPENMSSRRTAKRTEQLDAVKDKVPMGNSAQAIAAAQAMAGSTQLSLEVLPPDTDLDAAKSEMASANAKRSSASGGNSRLALAVIPTDAVSPAPGEAYSGFKLFVAPKLDPEVKGDITDQFRRAIVDARIEAGNLDVRRVRSMMSVPEVTAMTVTAEGERQTSDAAAILIPAAFMVFLWISVFTAGQYLLTSTIEEKSNRVMEVLLSAVSPMQLMVGKIVAQMVVGAIILCTYSGAGLIALAYFAMSHLIDPMNLVYLFIYFLIAFFLVASLMAAVGSAVSDVREAQSLLGPIMIVLVIPMMLWMPILRNPNSAFAQIVSFVPPVSPFVMVLRLAGSEPVPFWQIPATIVVGIISSIIAAWAAAKIFRIGVLMYGKPPNFATLLKWIRMA